jgi:hypothetical protein
MKDMENTFQSKMDLMKKKYEENNDAFQNELAALKQENLEHQNDALQKELAGLREKLEQHNEIRTLKEELAIIQDNGRRQKRENVLYKPFF